MPSDSNRDTTANRAGTGGAEFASEGTGNLMTNEPMRQLLECKRCRYGVRGEWRRRTKGRLPKQCPNCKSYRWDEDEVRGRGRPPKNAVELLNSLNGIASDEIAREFQKSGIEI